ncbi:MAG: sulfatase, partial [Rikenellaceae bacterium]
MKRSITAALAATTLVACNESKVEQPNIILFLVDDMGWQDTSLPFHSDTTMWNRLFETPNMERLARQG